MAKTTKPTGWDIQITPAGPDDPIFRGGLRMNAVQQPAESSTKPQKGSDSNSPTEPNSVSAPVTNNKN